MLSLLLAGCSTTASTLAGRALLPEFVPPVGGTAFFKGAVNTTISFPCGDTYCFASGGTVATGRDGRIEPANLDSLHAVSASDGAWTWRLETGDDPYPRPLAAVATPEPGVVCTDLPPGALDGRELPPRTRNLACALRRTHRLMQALFPATALPPVNVTVTLVPFGYRARRMWANGSSHTVLLHFLYPLREDGSLGMGDLATLVAHETAHALSATGVMPWGASGGDGTDPALDMAEERRAFTLEACARAVVVGRDLKTTWTLGLDMAAIEGRVEGGLLGSALAGTLLPIDVRAEQAFIDRYKAANGGSADYDGTDPLRVAALFGLCRRVAGGDRS